MEFGTVLIGMKFYSREKKEHLFILQQSTEDRYSAKLSLFFFLFSVSFNWSLPCSAVPCLIQDALPTNKNRK